MIRQVIDARVGSAFRTVRQRLGLRQKDVAEKAGVTPWLIRKIERGELDGVRVGSLRRIGEALGIRIVVDARWRGSELDRLLNARHSALHESLARYLSSLPGWVFEPEVSFAFYRDRGIVDILAWHAGRRALLLIELKTELVDVQEAVGTFDVKWRVARQIARGRGWFPEVIAGWLVIADTTTNRRRVTAHKTMLRAAFPADGHAIRSWLRSPDASIRGLSFWSEARSTASKPRPAPCRRVRRFSIERRSRSATDPDGGRSESGGA